jgi:NifU-like protein involved in Fe-S cluster formation
MRLLMLGFIAFVLSGCGAETATTAATSAAIKKKEIIEGQKLQDDTKVRIERSMSQTQQRTEKDSER